MRLIQIIKALILLSIYQEAIRSRTTADSFVRIVSTVIFSITNPPEGNTQTVNTVEISLVTGFCREKNVNKVDWFQKQRGKFS